jgi:hypothetical protein
MAPQGAASLRPDWSGDGLERSGDHAVTGEAIEIVAKAIIGTMFVEHELPLEDEIYQKYLVTARAAIEAMREPTEAMMVAAAPALEGVNSLLQIAQIHGAKLEWTNGEPPLKHAWRAMIDAALGNP